MIPPGTIRAGPIVPILELLRGFGIDPDPTLAAAGMAPGMLENTETPVAFAAAGRLLALCAERTGCAYFGLLTGQRAGLSGLGVLGMVMQNSPDVRTALQTLASNFNLHDGGGELLLRSDPAVATFGYRIFDPTIPGIEQATDCALAMGVQVMQSLCGPGWRATEVLVARPPPADLAPYRTLTDAPLRFGAAETALNFDPAWLDRRLSHALPAVRTLLLDFMRERRIDPGDVLRDDVRQLLRTHLPQGDASLANIAAALGLRPRTLHRRLAASGTTFKALAGEVRFETARQLLAQTAMPLGRIAALLGYSEAGSFTRSFHKRAGMPPASWRARQQRT